MNKPDRSPYIVQPGHSIRALGKSHRDGATVQLTDRDGARLTASGAVKPAGEPEQETPDSPLAALQKGKAADVTAALAGLDAVQLTELAALEAAAPKPRSTVLAAIEARQAELAKPADPPAA